MTSCAPLRYNIPDFFSSLLGDNLIEEANTSGAVVARYEQTQNIDEPLAMLRSSARSYYNADGLSSVTSLTNSSGAGGRDVLASSTNPWMLG